VTEQITGIDHRAIADPRGARLSAARAAAEYPEQGRSRRAAWRSSAASRRKIPRNNFIPIMAARDVSIGGGFGIRLDAGSAFGGAVITPVLRFAAGKDHGTWD
jgi:pyruvate carboxylase